MSKVFVDAVFKFVTKTFWPWFLKHIWPVIVKHVISLFVKGVENLSGKIEKSVSDRMRKRQSDAEASAKASGQAAAEAKTKSERERHEALATVWRQVAEQFRLENEVLKNQIAELASRTKNSLKEDMQLIQPSLENISVNPLISIAGKTSQLPALTFSESASLPRI